MGDTDEEKAWVLQSRNGDPAAFESLIRTHQRMTGDGSRRVCSDLINRGMKKSGANMTRKCHNSRTLSLKPLHL
jgi:hypothetical protein